MIEDNDHDKAKDSSTSRIGDRFSTSYRTKDNHLYDLLVVRYDQDDRPFDITLR
jgi:hypothetical protein